jgi:hypothetical protein
MRRKRRTVHPAQPAKSREQIEAQYGRAWDTAELAREFIVTAIIFHHVVVRRKGDDAVGTLEYQHGPPCLYFNFVQQPSAE